MSVSKILIIEDNPSDVYILRSALHDVAKDFELEIINDGAKAIHFIRQQRETRSDWRPCVIVMDLHIPTHDGLEVLRSIRQEPVLQHIHVVLLTTSASPRQEAELRRMGADYRLKPVGLPGYLELAANLIDICKGLLTVVSQN